MSRVRRGTTFGFAFACALALVAPARADDVAEARAAYDRGAKAYDTGDFSTAAVEFARADALAPNATVLELALKSSIKADDPILAMPLVERAEGRNAQGQLAETARAARERFSPRVGQLVVRCSGCTATLDGALTAVGVKSWVLAGSHEVVVSLASGARERVPVQVAAGALVNVEPAPKFVVRPPPPVPAEPKSSPGAPGDGRISPVLFWVGVGATLVLGGAAVASAVDTRNRHEAFLQSPSEAASQDGRASQIRTNVLIGASAATGVLTAALGAFAVRW
jgi:hypothetical protein